MKTCDWCGLPLGQKPRTGAGEWYNTCSESCRLKMVDSIRSGKTAEFKTPFEGLIQKLLPLVLVTLVLGFIGKSCTHPSNSPLSAEQSSSALGAGAMVEEKAHAPHSHARRQANTAHRPASTFGEPGQFDEPTAAPKTAAPSDEALQTIPAPTSEASGTAF